MKKIVLLFVAMIAFILSTTCAYAQTPIATLNHKDTLTTFSGTGALKEAYTKAIAGDVITLSAGMFQSVDIKKNITIRGAGMGLEMNADSTYVLPTVLMGNFTIFTNGLDNDIKLRMEGVYAQDEVQFWNVYLADFLKCHFHSIKYVDWKDYNFAKHKFIHCFFDTYIGNFNTVLEAFSCYFKNSVFSSSDNSKFILNNCIVETRDIDSPKGALSNCSLNNCIIINRHGGDNIDNHIDDKNTSAFNCLWYGRAYTNPFGKYGTDIYGVNNYNNRVFPSDKQLFKNQSMGILSDEGKKYLGSDKTEVGLYGGSLPFSTFLSNPQIKVFEVAKKTTADGKLNIHIEMQQQ